MPPSQNLFVDWATMTGVITFGGSGGSGGLDESLRDMGGSGGKGGKPEAEPGGMGGSVCTNSRHNCRSRDVIASQRAAFLKNWIRSRGVMVANLRNELMHCARCAGGNRSKACAAFSISCRSVPGSAAIASFCSGTSMAQKR